MANTVVGSAVFHGTCDIHLSWDSPLTGAPCWVQGEVFWNNTEHRYEHVVYDEEGTALYLVIAE